MPGAVDRLLHVARPSCAGSVSEKPIHSACTLGEGGTVPEHLLVRWIARLVCLGGLSATGWSLVGCAASSSAPQDADAITTTQVASVAPSTLIEATTEQPPASPAPTAPVVTAPPAPSNEDVLLAARAASSQAVSASLEGFETVWEISTSIPATDPGYDAGKVVCEAVLGYVRADRKNVTVKSDEGHILATGVYSGDCTSWR